MTRETEKSVRARTAALKAAPSAEDLRREVHAKIEYGRDGDFTATVPREHIKRAHEMMGDVRRIRRDRSMEFKSRHTKERLVNKNGKVVDIREDFVDRFKHKGLRPAGRNGRSAVLYFSAGRSLYEQGPDGLYFEWDGGWTPSTFSLSALQDRFGGEVPSPQRDPDGNVWVRDSDGEWVLESEVA